MINKKVLFSVFAGIMLSMICSVTLSYAKPTATNVNQKGNGMSLLPAIEFETKENPDATIIWLHGLGADGNDFAPIIPELRLPQDLAIRFIFPHAPSIPVTINGGFVMPAWYDILDMQIDRKVDIAQLMLSAGAINNFIDNELQRGINSERIILAGFSQGGAVVYQVALSRNDRLGGLLAMSTYFATADTIKLSDENKDIDIEIHHGIHDPVVPQPLGQEAFDTLKKLGYSAEYRTYPMEHSVCVEQINDISQWIQERLK